MVTQMTRHLFSTCSHVGSSVTGLNSSLVACEQAPSLEGQVQKNSAWKFDAKRRARGGSPCSTVRAEFSVLPPACSSKLGACSQATPLETSESSCFCLNIPVIFLLLKKQHLQEAIRCSDITPFARLNKGASPSSSPFTPALPDNSSLEKEICNLFLELFI